MRVTGLSGLPPTTQREVSSTTRSTPARSIRRTRPGMSLQPPSRNTRAPRRARASATRGARGRPGRPRRRRARRARGIANHGADVLAASPPAPRRPRRRRCPSRRSRGASVSSTVSTSVSPPLTSSTAPVVWRLVIRKRAACAMSSGVPIRPTGIASATRRRKLVALGGGEVRPHLAVGVAGPDRVHAQRPELERQRARQRLDGRERRHDHRGVARRADDRAARHERDRAARPHAAARRSGRRSSCRAACRPRTSAPPRGPARATGRARRARTRRTGGRARPTPVEQRAHRRLVGHVDLRLPHAVDRRRDPSTGRRPAATTSAPCAAAARAVASPMPLVPPTTTTRWPASVMARPRARPCRDTRRPISASAASARALPRAAPADLGVELAGGEQREQVGEVVAEARRADGERLDAGSVRAQPRLPRSRSSSARATPSRRSARAPPGRSSACTSASICPPTLSSAASTGSATSSRPTTHLGGAELGQALGALGAADDGHDVGAGPRGELHGEAPDARPRRR